MKILGLDIGQRRIGVAIALGKIASSYAVIEMTDLTKTMAEVAQIIRKENIEKIVIGIPKNKDTFQADRIHKFAIELTKNVNLPVEYLDETLTSKEAERLLKASNLDPKSEKYREMVDKISAKLILEQYLGGEADL